MTTEGNPFDRSIQNRPLIRFFIHSDSLSKELLSGDSAANRLIKLNSLAEIETIPLPTDDNSIRNILGDSGLKCTEYNSHSLGVELRVSDGSIWGVTPQPPPNLWERIVPGSTVTLADIFASNIGDYLVVSGSDPVLTVKIAKNNIITAEQALDLVRILLAAHGIFYLRPSMRVNEGFYYLFRFKNLFKIFQHAWTIATYTHGSSISEKLYDYLASLETRLELMCRAYDKIAFFSLKTANHDTQNNQLYHLIYFVMLITGVFDNLANIIAEFYHMEIKGRMTVGLRTPAHHDKKTQKFYQLLQSKNGDLYKFLISLDIQSDIGAFYPLRDCLAHRELPTGVHYSKGFEMGKNVFELNNETYKRIRQIPDSSKFVDGANPHLLYPLPFIQWAQEVIITLVNHILYSIDWDSVCATLTQDIQDKIHASDDSFQQGVGQFLGFSVEPLYF